jgi:hypothetical protein
LRIVLGRDDPDRRLDRVLLCREALDPRVRVGLAGVAVDQAVDEVGRGGRVGDRVAVLAHRGVRLARVGRVVLVAGDRLGLARREVEAKQRADVVVVQRRGQVRRRAGDQRHVAGGGLQGAVAVAVGELRGGAGLPAEDLVAVAVDHGAAGELGRIDAVGDLRR